MPPKKNKVQEKNACSEKVSNEDKFILLRDLSTEMLLIVGYKDISISKNFKNGVGEEVTYIATNRSRGRGTILLIATDEECMKLLVVLEKGNMSKDNNDSPSKLFIADDEQRSEHASEDEELEPSTNKENDEVIVTNYVDSSNINVKNSVSNRSPSENNKRALPLLNKTSAGNDDNIAAPKRFKHNDDGDKYLRGRLMVLQDENKRLKNKIKEIETTWMRTCIVLLSPRLRGNTVHLRP